MIFVEDCEVKIGGCSLPGVFKSIEINGNAIIDEIETESKGKKPKQATGYEDMTVKLEISLDKTENQSIEDKIKYINDIFHPSGETVPKLYKIVNAHTAARGITEVIFKSFSTKETNKNDEIICTLEFCECPKITVVKKSVAATSLENQPPSVRTLDGGVKQDSYNEDYSLSFGEFKERANSIKYTPSQPSQPLVYKSLDEWRETSNSSQRNPLQRSQSSGGTTKEKTFVPVLTSFSSQ